MMFLMAFLEPWIADMWRHHDAAIRELARSSDG